MAEPVPEPSPHGRIPEAGDLLPVLHQARRQLIGVAARLSAIAVGDDRGRVAEARYEVTWAGDKLTNVMRARASRLVTPGGWLRLPGALLAAALYGPVILLGAVLFTLGGTSLPWMVVGAFALYIVAESPVLWLVRSVDGLLTRLTVARTLRAEPAGNATARDPADSQSGPDQDLAIIGSKLRDAAHEIALVRNDLAEVAHQHLTRHPRQPPDTPAGLAWLMRDDRMMNGVMSALSSVTQAYEACVTESELIRLWMTLPTRGADS
jgi:hypothetical protein